MPRISTVLLALLAPLSALAAPQTYNVDALHSYPTFTVNHLGMATMHGRF
ncbi:YceI family protein [Polaromonas sp. P1(28)-8]|nr:YceI family protein [Polaromonas sp. P1(28)-8]